MGWIETGDNLKNWPQSLPRPGGDSLPIALVRAFRRHPAFPEAMHRSALALLAAHDHDRLLNRLISDRGRMLFGIFAIYAHFEADETGVGLTPSRMATLCAEAAVCSRGRVKALMMLLRWAGYLATGPAGEDRRTRTLVPTERMISAYCRRWREQLLIIAPMVPEVTTVASALEREDVFATMGVALGRALHGGFRVLDHAPALAGVAERDNGLLVIMTLALAGPADMPIATRGPVSMTIAEIAARARISRSHALNVLREAESCGLIQREAEGILCLPLLEESLRGFFAAALAAVAAAGCEAAARMREAGPFTQS